MRLIVGILVMCAPVMAVHAQDLTRAGNDSGSLAAPLDRTSGQLTRVFVQPMDVRDKWSGSLLNLGPDTLTLLIAGHRLDLPLEQVRRIQAAGDTVRNGARISALVAGLRCAVACSHGLDGARHWPAAVALAAGMGVAIGVGIDAAIPGRTTLYRRSTSTSSADTADRAAVFLRFPF